MSLLMDALRKAEDAKRQADQNSSERAPAAAELTLEPVHRPAASPLPDLAQHSATLDADLSAVAAGAPLRTRASRSASPAADNGGREAAERLAARNLFAAKTPARTHRGRWLAAAAAAVLAALTIGAYFWWQISSLPSGKVRPSQAAPAPTPSAPVAPPAPTAAVQPLAAANPTTTPATTPAAASVPAPMPAPAAAAQQPPPASPAPMTSTRSEAPAAKRRTVDSLPAAARGADGAPRLSKGRQPTTQIVERAFAALQSGQTDLAQRDYEQLVHNDPRNIDALLGLATIATRQGRPDQAQAYYLRALEADPGDATAQAGLINGRGQSDPALSESRLKSALEAQPESSALHFALGNLYSRQSRWSEAQQAYFRAYATEPDNADIIYNLAVSLDHLRQNKLAAQYYQMALTAAQGRAVLFDSGQTRKRIEELQP